MYGHSSSSQQYRPRILCRGPVNSNNGGTNNYITLTPNSANTTNGSVENSMIQNQQQLLQSVQHVSYADNNDIQLNQQQHILVNNEMASTLPALNEVNQRPQGVFIEHVLPQDFQTQANEMVFIKLDDEQLLNSIDESQNIVITLNEDQLNFGEMNKTVTQVPTIKEEKKPIVENTEDINATINELLGEVVDQIEKDQQALAKLESVERKQTKSKSTVNANVKVEKVEKVYNDIEPIVWENGIGTLPGTELTFHISEEGLLELYCPFIPIQEKMDRAVLKLNIKRADKLKYTKSSISSEPSNKINSKPVSNFGSKTTNGQSKPNSNPIQNVKNKSQANGKTKNNCKTTKLRQAITSSVNRFDRSKSTSLGSSLPVNKTNQAIVAPDRTPDKCKAFKSIVLSPVIKSEPLSPPLKAAANEKPIKTYRQHPLLKSKATEQSNTDNSQEIKKIQPDPPGNAAKSVMMKVAPKFNKIQKPAKPKQQECTVKTTLCGNCACLGVVADFIEGKFCSRICQRTVKMVAAEELKLNQQLAMSAGGQTKEGFRIKRKYEKKKKPDNPTDNKPTQIKETPGPLVYAKKTTVPIVETNDETLSAQRMLAASIGTPNLFVDRQEDVKPQPKEIPQSKSEGLPLNQGPVELKIEESKPSQASTKIVKTSAKVSKTKSNMKQSVLARKHRKRTKPKSKRSFGQVLNTRSSNLKTEQPSITEILKQTFNWTNYLRETKSKAAPNRLFRQPAMPLQNPFKIGMMMEAIDPQHQSLFCVVTVVDTQGYRLRLRFTGYAEVYDFWTNADSFDIFPPGWCEENGQELLPPPDYTGGTPFNWHQYIVDTDSATASRDFFAISHEDTPTSTEVQVGMKLEAVDLKNLNYVCVATVGNVIGDRFLIHFDSWDNLFDYWTDLTSPFIHPIGWCKSNGRDLVPPQYDGDDSDKPFIWEQYLKETKSIPMPAKLFRPLPPVNFKKGMKLECVDKRNPFLIRVATIEHVESHFITIHFDGWPAKYDYKVYELSPDIHWAGWCTSTKHSLQPPTPESANANTWPTKPCPVFGCIGLGHIKGPKFLTHNAEKNCPYAEANYQNELILVDRLTSYVPGGSGSEKSNSGSRRTSTTAQAETSFGFKKRTSETDASLTEIPFPSRRASEIAASRAELFQVPIKPPSDSVVPKTGVKDNTPLSGTKRVSQRGRKIPVDKDTEYYQPKVSRSSDKQPTRKTKRSLGVEELEDPMTRESSPVATTKAMEKAAAAVLANSSRKLRKKRQNSEDRTPTPTTKIKKSVGSEESKFSGLTAEMKNSELHTSAPSEKTKKSFSSEENHFAATNVEMTNVDLQTPAPLKKTKKSVRSVENLSGETSTELKNSESPVSRKKTKKSMSSEENNSAGSFAEMKNSEPHTPASPKKAKKSVSSEEKYSAVPSIEIINPEHNTPPPLKKAKKSISPVVSHSPGSSIEMKDSEIQTPVKTEEVLKSDSVEENRSADLTVEISAESTTVLLQRTTLSPSTSVSTSVNSSALAEASSTTETTEPDLPINFSKNIQSIQGLVAESKLTPSIVSNWGYNEVAAFVIKLGCPPESFIDQKIDGESFLLLTQRDITNDLGIALGPALKLANALRLIHNN